MGSPRTISTFGKNLPSSALIELRREKLDVIGREKMFAGDTRFLQPEHVAAIRDGQKQVRPHDPPDFLEQRFDGLVGHVLEHFNHHHRVDAAVGERQRAVDQARLHAEARRGGDVRGVRVERRHLEPGALKHRRIAAGPATEIHDTAAGARLHELENGGGYTGHRVAAEVMLVRGAPGVVGNGGHLVRVYDLSTTFMTSIAGPLAAGRDATVFWSMRQSSIGRTTPGQMPP